MVRAQYYTGLALSRQTQASPFKYDKLIPIIFVGVLDHILFETVADVITLHALMDIKNHTISSLHQTFHIVELPKFTKTIDQLDSDIDQWLFFMNNADEFEAVPQEMLDSKKIKEAFHIIFWIECDGQNEKWIHIWQKLILLDVKIELSKVLLSAA